MAAESKRVTWSLDEEGGFDPRLGIPAQPTDSLSRPQKPVKLTIFSMIQDVSVEKHFASGRLTTAEDIHRAVFEELDLPEDCKEVFSVWLSSKHLQLQLKPYHCPCKLFKRWKDLLTQFTSVPYKEMDEDEPILVFQRNVFYHLKEERKLLSKTKGADTKMVDQMKKVIDHLYWEAKVNVVQGRYPMTPEELHTLAGYQAAIDLGPYSADTATPHHIKQHLPSLYPKHMLGSSPKKLFRSSSERLENKLLESYQAASQKSSDVFNIKVLYLQLCWSKPVYGSVFFWGQIERPSKLVHKIAYHDKPVLLAINPDCIHLFGAEQPPETLLYLTYDQLSWAFEPSTEEGENFYSCLWVEFDSFIRGPNGEDQRVAKRTQIFSRQAPMMDAMIELCVENINIKEATLRRVKKDQENASDLPQLPHYVWKSGDQKLKQSPNCKEDKLVCTVISEEGKVIEPVSRLGSLKRQRKPDETMSGLSPPPLDK
ncbi:hypothetical protein EMCRGX_G032108 [Ephydatia muelleri]